MFSVRSLTAILVCTLLTTTTWGALDAKAQPETNRASLQALSLRLQAKFMAGRGPAYQALLQSTDRAQLALNKSETKQLMYVDENGKPHYYTTDNVIAARTVSTDKVWPGGGYGYSLTGSGTALGKLGIWDGGGVLTTHQEFGGRVTQMDSPGGTSTHATHVAGTLVAGGVAPSAKGMSYEANLAARDWNNDESEMASAAASGMNVSNHSYGYVAGWSLDTYWYWYGDLGVSTTEDWGFGFYDSHARDWDNIAYNAPYYTIVISAGNDRGDDGPGAGNYHYHWNGGWVWANDTHEIDGGADGYDCLASPHTAKNPMIVGAVNDIDGGYSDPSDVVATSFTSWGPTDDGRIKPDVVANGQGLYSCSDASVTSYAIMSGTSMSSPNAAGSINLLVRHYESTHGSSTPLASTIKAVAIQTADEAGSNTGPDYKFGWGLLNTLHAADLISADATSPTMIYENYLADVGGGDADTLYFYSSGVDPLRLTLAWTDPKGTPPPTSLNPTTLMLVNDLDLRVVHTGGPTTYYPYVLDPSNPADAATTGDNYRDNVEQVYVASPPAGEYMAIVSHKGNLTADQWYSLVSSEPMDETGHDSTAPTVSVTAPNGGEDWTVGQVYDIAWTASDAHGIDYVDIYYSYDAGRSYTPISLGEAGDSPRAWTVPDTPTDSAVVKIIAYDPWANSAQDRSDAFFAISPPPDTTAPTVTLTGPNGGESWFSGSLHNITWTASDDAGVDSVSIYYSVDGGAAYDLVASSEPNDGVYPWTVPDTSTVSAKVKVVAYDPSLNQGEDESDAVFEIIHDVDPPAVLVISPNGGDSLQVSDVYDINWIAYDSTYAAADDFEDGNDDGWSHFCGTEPCTYTVSGGVYEIAGNPGPATSMLDATNGWTDYLFEADVRIDSGTARTLLFRFSDSYNYYRLRILPVRMVLSRHTILSDTTLVTLSGLSFSTGVWYSVRIIATGANIKVSVDGVPRIDVTDPDPVASGAAGLMAQSGETVLFDNVLVASSYGIDSVDILYSTDGGATFPHTIATGEPNDFLYQWTVPDTPTDNALVKVVARDLVANEGEDVSDAVFTIGTSGDVTPPDVAVMTPNGAETWYVGDVEDITWTATDDAGVDSVSIYYSVNGGGDWILIASQESNDGLYPWNVPDTPTADALVKVVAYDPSLNEGEDVSDAVFAIEPPPDLTPPAVTVLAPNKGDSLEVGAAYDITWTATDAGGVDSVSIFYSVNGGGSYLLIASGEANDGVHSWTVPASPTDSAMVKVVAYDPSLNAGQDESDSLNVIYELTVGVPGGGRDFGKAVLLWQNAPNPFSPVTSISFYLPREGPVFLDVFDATGRLVDVVIDGEVYGAGVSTVSWTAEDGRGARLSAGVYFYRLRTDQGVKTRKMVIAH